MNPRNRMQQLMALLGAAGVSAAMGLPALAQQGVVNNGAANNGVLNPNPSILNEAPYNRSQVSDRCANYIQGGVGGPIDNTAPAQSDINTPQSSAVDNNTTRSSDAVAGQGVAGTSPFNTDQSTSQTNDQANSGMVGSNMNQMQSNRSSITRQFDGNNPAAGVAFRQNAIAATSGREASENLEAYTSGQMGQTQAMAPMNNSISLNRAELNRQQFDASNPAAGVAFRPNGVAATSGREASENLEAFSNSADRTSNIPVSGNYNTSTTAPQSPSLSASPLPAECTP